MMTIGIDAHKFTHTAVAVDELGRQAGTPKRTTGTTGADHLGLLRWAVQFSDRVWAIEDCRHVSRRLEADLLAAGEKVVRVPPKLMAGARDSARTPGKSDPIDALAVARAALREPDLPVATLDGVVRELRLLVDHRDDLVAERTRHINRLRWYLHELEPGWNPTANALTSLKQLAALTVRLGEFSGAPARLGADQVARVRELTITINQLASELARIVTPLAPTLLAVHGVGVLTAAKIIGQVGDIGRFRNADRFARHNGTAPIPASSGNSTRHRLNRGGNRQLNAALHRIAVTQQRSHPDAIAYTQRRLTTGNTPKEARRSLKRRLSNIVYRALHTDAHLLNTTTTNTIHTAA